MSVVVARATRQPMKPWAITNPQGGIVTRPSNQDRQIAAPIAPSMSAAGSRISSKPATKTTDAPRSAAHWMGWGVWRSVNCDIPSSVAKGEGVGIGYPRDPRKDMPHRPVVGFGAQARGDVAGDHQLIAKLPGLPRGGLDSDMRGDAAEDDRAYVAPRELGIEVCVEKCAPGRLGDEDVAGLRKTGRKIDETRGQGLGQRCRLVDLSLRPIKFWRRVHQHHWRVSDTKFLRQRLATRDQIVGGDRSKFPAENPVLQVDQHERGRLRVECDHRRGSSGRVARSRFMRDTRKSSNMSNPHKCQPKSKPWPRSQNASGESSGSPPSWMRAPSSSPRRAMRRRP